MVDYVNLDLNVSFAVKKILTNTGASCEFTPAGPEYPLPVEFIIPTPRGKLSHLRSYHGRTSKWSGMTLLCCEEPSTLHDTEGIYGAPRH